MNSWKGKPIEGNRVLYSIPFLVIRFDYLWQNKGGNERKRIPRDKRFRIFEVCEEIDGIKSVNFREVKLEEIYSEEVEKCIEQLKEYFAGKEKLLI